MIIKRDKFLIISNNYNDNFIEDSFLLQYLSELEFKRDGEFNFILDEKYNIKYIYKLLNILSYLSLTNSSNHFIRIFTSNDKFIKLFTEQKEMLGLNGYEMFELNKLLDYDIIDSFTREIKNSNKYFNIIKIEKDIGMIIYNPNYYLPNIRIKIKKR